MHFNNPVFLLLTMFIVFNIFYILFWCVYPLTAYCDIDDFDIFVF